MSDTIQPTDETALDSRRDDDGDTMAVEISIPPTPDEVARAAAIRAASDPTKPNAPEAPSTAALDYVPPAPDPSAATEDAAHAATNEQAEDGIHKESGLDARLHMAHGLARRGLAFASINDLAKAVLLMLDMHRTPKPADSPVAIAAARGEGPPLL